MDLGLFGLIFWGLRVVFACEFGEINAPVIVFLGAPCSGKGTQVDLLKERLNIPAFQTRELFRAEARSGSLIGKQFAEIMNSGGLIPQELSKDLIIKTLSSNKYQNGVILDGYPRTCKNFNSFEEVMKLVNLEVDIFVILDLDYETLVERVQKRLVCQNCGASTSKDYNPESVICCKNPDLITRRDDSVQVYERRYEGYLSNTIPLIHKLQADYSDKIIYLNSETLSNRSKEEISDIIYNSITDLLSKKSKIDTCRDERK